jgi:hypothetical protein
MFSKPLILTASALFSLAGANKMMELDARVTQKLSKIENLKEDYQPLFAQYSGE